MYGRAELWSGSRCSHEAASPAHSTDLVRQRSWDCGQGRSSTGMGLGSSLRPSRVVPEDGQPQAALALLSPVGWRESLVLPRTCPTPGSGCHGTGSGDSPPRPSDPSQVSVTSTSASASTELEETKPQPWQRLEELLAEASLSLRHPARPGPEPVARSRRPNLPVQSHKGKTPGQRSPRGAGGWQGNPASPLRQPRASTAQEPLGG